MASTGSKRRGGIFSAEVLCSGVSSERLPYREEKLEMTDPLPHRGCRAEQKILITAFQAIECRRIETISQIDTNWPYRRAIAYAESGSMHYVIEIRNITLPESEG